MEKLEAAGAIKAKVEMHSGQFRKKKESLTNSAMSIELYLYNQYYAKNLIIVSKTNFQLRQKVRLFIYKNERRLQI